ncbi:hypothetical protein [Absidia glauca]|uniref:Peptidase S54 rhomboid domain-containing protein n=1 Tax=Absidia glauca TaxID=4829 RepID=A0A163K6F0_ABSGL|nr:hypothetical protein [Absidia glauca]
MIPSKTLFDLPKKDNRHHWIPSIFNDDLTDKDEETGDAFYQTQSSWVMVFRSGMKPFGKKKWPVVTTYILLAVMFMILSGELLLSQQTSNEFLELDPFNVMLGPSIQILIQTGARFPPCMRPTEVMQPDARYVCLNTTLSTMNATWTTLRKTDNGKATVPGILDPISDPGLLQNSSCSLQDICGMSGFAYTLVPDQSFRFFTPLFVHAGVLHYLIDACLLWFVAKDLERIMNPIRFAAVYILSGLFGNAFGSIFAMPTNPFMGCHPSISGLFGCSLIDLFFMWPLVRQPFRHVIKIMIFIASSFLLGLLPGVDNFTLAGGLIGGLLIGVVSMPTVYNSKRYQIMIWCIRLISLSMYLLLTILLWRTFYQADDPGKSCTFCRYVSCLPIGGFCD